MSNLIYNLDLLYTWIHDREINFALSPLDYVIPINQQQQQQQQQQQISCQVRSSLKG